MIILCLRREELVAQIGPPMGCSRNDRIQISFAKGAYPGFLCVPVRRADGSEDRIVREARVVFQMGWRSFGTDCKILTAPLSSETKLDELSSFVRYKRIEGNIRMRGECGCVERSICLLVKRSCFAPRHDKEAAQFIADKIPVAGQITVWSKEELLEEVRSRVRFPEDIAQAPLQAAVKAHTLVGDKVLVLKAGVCPEVVRPLRKRVATGGYHNIYLGNRHYERGDTETVVIRVYKKSQDRLFVENNFPFLSIYEKLQGKKGCAVPTGITYETLGSFGRAVKKKYLEMLPLYDLENLGVSKNYFTTFEEKKNVVRQMIEAVMTVHEQGIIHRDIKLHNFLVDGSGGFVKVGLSDLDTAMFCEPNGEVVIPNYCGTSIFMPPESMQRMGDRKTAAKTDDLWALGLALYEFVYHRLPPHISTLISQWEGHPDQDKMVFRGLFDLHRNKTHEVWWKEQTFFAKLDSEQGRFRRMVLLLLHPNPEERISAREALELLSKIGAEGFEPPAYWSQTSRASQTALCPVKIT
jgi:hypothetical protein